jgi:hypothetical protein
MFKELPFLYTSNRTCIKITIFYVRHWRLLKPALMTDIDFDWRNRLEIGRGDREQGRSTSG